MRVQPLRVLRTLFLVFVGAFLMQLYQLTLMASYDSSSRASSARAADFSLESVNASRPVSTSASSSSSTISSTTTTSKQNSSGCGGQVPSTEDLRAPEDWKVFKKDHFMYSAFFDKRIKPRVIKITAVVPRKAVFKIYCNIFYADKTEAVSTPGKVVAIGEGMAYRFQAVWVVCTPSDQESTPIAVGLSAEHCGQSVVHLPVITPEPQPSFARQFTVCICGPVKFNYSDNGQLVEWIETNSLFGAERFVVYNHSSRPSLLPYVDYYERLGKLEFRKWNLPLGKPDIKNFAHMVLLSDCLYRNMYHSKYITFLDLDELLVPKQYSTWKDVMVSQKCDAHASVNFKNVFFKLEWEMDEVSSQNKTLLDLGFKSFLYTKREIKIWPHKSRSKYIVRPELILEPGVHYPHKYLSAKNNCDIHSDLAWVQHYRNWNDPSSKGVLDRTIEKYANSLITAGNATHAAVRGL